MDKYADILGVGGASGAATPKQYVVPDNVLDGLRQVESSGNRFAVNPSTGAMGPYQFMPSTVAALRKQGMNFDPFDEAQSREAAATYLGHLVQKHGGDIKKALADYGGFVTKDPTSYVTKVLTAGGQSSVPAAIAPPAQADPYADILGIGKPAQPIQSAPAPQVAQAQDPLRMRTDQQIKDTGQQIRGVVANQLTGLGSTIVGGYRGLATLLTGGTLEDAANNVNDYVQGHTFQGNTKPQQEAIESYASSANPQNIPSQLIDKASDYTADKFGPLAGTAVKTGLNAALLIAGTRGTPGSAAVDVGPSRPGVGVYRNLRVGNNPMQQMLEQEYPGLRPQSPAGAQVHPTPQAPTQSAQQAAPTQHNQPASTNPADRFREIAPTEKPLGDVKNPTPEMQRRAQVLKSVGIEQARESSLKGDRMSGGTDYQISKMDSPAGRLMADQMAQEKQALANHATQLVEKTGGTLNVDQGTQYQRGQTVVAPLNDLKRWYDTKATELYNAANERAQGQSVDLGTFRQTLNDASEMTSPDRLTFRDAAKAFAKKNGMLQEDGSISGNALQAETFRKWLNKNRNYSNGSFVDGLKEALDNDVMSSAGEDLYTQARSLWQQRKATLGNPNGIAKLMQEEGVNRAVPYEQVAPTIARMPVDQFSHVVDTLKNAPKEVQPSAQTALNEIRAHFANEVRSTGAKHQGQWNAAGVTKYLRDNAARMNEVFSPEEMQQFQNLNEAGQIVAKDQSYPGAAVQEHNLARAGMTAAVRYGASATGGAIGSLVGAPGAGAAVGGYFGDKAAGALSEKASLKSAQKRMTKLSDFVAPVNK